MAAGRVSSARVGHIAHTGWHVRQAMLATSHDARHVWLTAGPLQDAHELEELRAEARRTLERVAEPHGDDALAQV